MSEPFDILLVEDNPDDVELTLETLKANRISNRVEVARDGAEALALLYDENGLAARGRHALPRLVLLDLKLPKVGGLEVLERLRADPRTSTIPVVVLTSSREDPDVAASYRLGANSYIVKPVEFDRFIVTIRELGFYWLIVNEPPGGRRQRQGDVP